MDESDEELYCHVARLAYLARFEVSDAWATAHRIAAAAVRRARKATKDSAMDQALDSIVAASRNPPRRARRRLGPVAPVKPTEAQADALHRLARYNMSARVGALLHLLDDVPVKEAASRIGAYPSTEGVIRDAVASIQGELTTRGIRELLAGAELDPMRVGVSGTEVVARRRRRIRRWLALGTVAVVALAAGVWWFGLRTPPLGTYADDPVVHDKPSDPDTLSIARWTARGELLGDTALLRRAANAWRIEGSIAPSGGPAVLFAGAVNHVKVVVMESGLLIAVYQDGSSNTARIWVNPTEQEAFSIGIRLMDDHFRVDWVLLPPGVTSAEAGSMTAPPSSWSSVPTDARGVAEVRGPQQTDDQIDQDEKTGLHPAVGIRFALPDTLGKIKENPITLAESFSPFAPVLPSVEPDDDARQTGTPLSAADWCVAQKTAEKSDALATYSMETMSDTAGGPLPDGGGTGTVVEQTVWAGNFGLTSDDPSILTNLELVSASGGTCAATAPPGGFDLDSFVLEGRGWPAEGQFADADAVFWTSPAKKKYLVVAASAKASGIRVSGGLTASAGGRWLVVPVPDAYTDGFAGVVVQAVDTQGHPCGSDVPGTTSQTYCS